MLDAATDGERELSIERLLCAFEKVYYRIGEVAPMNVSVVSRVRGPLTVESLRRGLEFIRRRHPLLRVRIEQTAQGAMFRTRGVPGLPMRRVHASSDQWAAVIEEEVNQPFPTNRGPLARCVLVRCEDELHHVVVTFHHVIGDAASGTYLMRDLIQGAGASQEAVTLPALSDVVPIALRLPRSHRGWRGHVRLLEFLFRTAREKRRFKGVDYVQADQASPRHLCRTGVLFHEFDESLSEQLAGRARREGTTVHGALSAAVCLNIARDIAEDRPIHLAHRTPVNVRKSLDPPVGDDFGLFVSAVFYRGQLSSQEDFWETARSIRRGIARQIEQGVPISAIRVMPLLYAMLGGDRAPAEQLAIGLRRYLAPTTALTNLGRVDIDTTAGSLKIESLHFAASIGLVGDLTCTATTLARRLRWNFMFSEPTFSRQRAARLVGEIVHRLERAVKTSTGS